MIPFEWYWAIFVLLAAALQTVRNAAQRTVAGTAGTIGGTAARFFYALPFAVLFLAVSAMFYGLPSRPPAMFFGWVAMSGVLQILATMALLTAMSGQSFAVAVSLSNTTPVQVAIFAFLILGEPLGLSSAFAVITAAVGMVAMSWPHAGAKFEGRAVAAGLMSGSFFALSAVGYRGATTSLDTPYLMSAALTLTIVLIYQSVILSAYMAWRAPDDLRAVLRVWRQSLLAGFAGACASQLWFSAYALEEVTRVRTLAVVELLYSQVVSARVFREAMRARELFGIACIVVAIVMILNA